MISARILDVRQRCAIGGRIRVQPGRYVVDQLTVRALRDGPYGAVCAILGGASKELRVHHAFTIERPTEVLGTGIHVVDAITGQTAIESQQNLIAQGLIRVRVPGPYEDGTDFIESYLVQGHEVIELTAFGRPRTLAQFVQTSPFAPALQLSEFGLDVETPLDLMDRSGSSGALVGARDRSERSS